MRQHQHTSWHTNGLLCMLPILCQHSARFSDDGRPAWVSDPLSTSMKQQVRRVLDEDSPGNLAFVFPNLVLRHSDQAASCHPASSTRAPAQPVASSDCACKQWTRPQQISLHSYVQVTQALKMLQDTTHASMVHVKAASEVPQPPSSRDH